LGIAVILLSMIAGIVLMYQSMRGDIGVPGWASIMVSIWFLGGVTIFCVGVLGIYLAKIFTETKNRPYTIVRRIYGVENDTPNT
jgi:putative glycosyltransferase